MNGILNILKPPGMTSFDIVSWLRRVTKVKKIGHTGTLDPMACGVLPVCIGNATKTIEYLVDKDKLYQSRTYAWYGNRHTGFLWCTVLSQKEFDVEQPGYL